VSGLQKSPEPFRIEPVFYPRIWGARSLARLFPEKTNLPEPIGEAWLTGLDCRVASGPLAGKSLGEAWRQMPTEWRGTRLASAALFPLLVKFIFPNDKLSIQVHPDDAYAAAHEQAAGRRGKTEMWHVVSAGPGAQVLLGLRPGTTKKQFLKSLHEQTLEKLFVACPVQPGDTFFVPAGTPHTIGPGMVLCEVQQYSDLTYRVYDYGRVDAHGKPRELHVEKALEVMDFFGSQGGKVAPVSLPAERWSKTLLAACLYFATERWEFRATVQSKSNLARFELFVVLAGTGYIHWKGSPMLYGRGQCWLIPATLGQFSLQPEQSTTVLRTYVPDLSDLAAELQASGVSGAQLAHTDLP
jgi:mannose-6-phosphate isomerase